MHASGADSRAEGLHSMQPDRSSGWLISTTDKIAYAPPALANGMIGIALSARALCFDQVILNGVHDKYGRRGQAYSLSPMGPSSTGYNGHVFWDCELWMFPPLLMLQPEIAHSVLDYRIRRLEPAMHNAISHSYRGARGSHRDPLQPQPLLCYGYS
jgi:Glycosyl hydrolase family 65 central catalytic domain